MGFFGIMRAEKINASALSDRIKPIYEATYAICQEFGYEEGYDKGIYDNYRYKDQNINIQHFHLERGSFAAFDIGRQVHVEYKGRCVFDCLIKLNGDIKLNVFESGEWTSYLSSLQRTLKLTLLARKKLEEYYKFGDIFYGIIQKTAHATVGSAYYKNRSFSADRFKVNYDIDSGYTFADDKIKIKFDRDEKKNVASAAVVTFKGKIVFNAVHFFPSGRRRFSSNTRCQVFESGEWEEYLMSAINSIKASCGA